MQEYLSTCNIRVIRYSRARGEVSFFCSRQQDRNLAVQESCSVTPPFPIVLPFEGVLTVRGTLMETSCALSISCAFCHCQENTGPACPCLQAAPRQRHSQSSDTRSHLIRACARLFCHVTAQALPGWSAVPASGRRRCPPARTPQPARALRAAARAGGFGHTRAIAACCACSHATRRTVGWRSHLRVSRLSQIHPGKAPESRRTVFSTKPDFDQIHTIEVF